MNCEMCGKQGQLFKTEIEGTDMKVCKICSKYGNVISVVKEPEKRKMAKDESTEKIEIVSRQTATHDIVDNYGAIISKKRQELGLKQKEFAVKIAERESIIQKIETSQMKPSLSLAKKLENVLGVKLIERHVEDPKQRYKAAMDTVTIGDFMLIKKSKKN